MSSPCRGRAAKGQHLTSTPYGPELDHMGGFLSPHRERGSGRDVFPCKAEVRIAHSGSCCTKAAKLKPTRPANWT